jgi:NADH dehydrogenase
VESCVHVSGIGADPVSTSRYIRSRGEGELAVRAAFPGAVIVRPAVMFAPDDAFLTAIMKLLRQFPIYPMFGKGGTRLQPVHVDDVAEAIARIVLGAEPQTTTFELAGPHVCTYEELIRSLAQELGRNRVLVPVPFAAWRGLAQLAEILPNPPITRNQVELMMVDTVASPELPGLTKLGIAPRSVDAVVREIMSAN